MSDVTQGEYPVWVEGRDAAINFRHEFCGSPSLETVLGDMENYTEYAEECEALADCVRIAAEKALLDRAWSLAGSDGLLEVELLERALVTKR